jgi:uncharacterized membrane protein YdbT with pleckstrin-like domain
MVLGVIAVVAITTLCILLRDRAGVFVAWAVLVVLAVLAVACRIGWSVLYCRYRLTDQRLFVDRGILTQTTDQTELIRVDDVRVRRTLPDRLFGLGSIHILSTDTTDQALVIEGVRAPNTIAEHVRTNMRALRRKSLFIENL